MRLYEKISQERSFQAVSVPASTTTPGMTLTETIDQFFAEGVVPDLLPADLGTDDAAELDADGLPMVDPMGDIRSDPFDLRERMLVKDANDKFAQAYADTGLDMNGNIPAPPAPADPASAPAE